MNEIDCISKENIVITVGRLGEYVKNNELLLDAIKLLPDDIVKNGSLCLLVHRRKHLYKL